MEISFLSIVCFVSLKSPKGVKKTLKAFPQTTRMIMPSAKNEIYLDLNGDGAADFAFISSKNDNNIDTFAVDTTGNGEFDLYLTDTDGNGIADDVSFYLEGSDEPSLSFAVRK